mmetsp:Transcript_45038/g.125268  ORF Transcript_45038/g.125268 Transcript_45038/m.125268 type:complete len:285 (+) Transcript_45038:1247-2101(+)
MRALVRTAFLMAGRLTARVHIQAQVVHGRKHTDGCFEDRDGGGVFTQAVVGEPMATGHLHVQAPLHGHGAVGGHPIGNHKALEAHDTFEVPVKDVLIFACKRSVDLVVRTHHSASTRLNGSLKGWVVQLPSRTTINLRVCLLPVGLLLIESEVLHHCHDSLSLYRTDKHLREASPKVRVLAREVLEIPPTTSSALHIDCWPKHDIRALPSELAANCRCHPPHKVLIPGRRQGKHTRPLSGCASLFRVRCPEPIVGVLHLQRRDSQAPDRVSVAHVVAWDGIGAR